MKNRKKLFVISATVCLLAAVCMACAVYFNFISRMVYEESSQHLMEIYSQINQSFQGMVSEKWDILKVWNHYLTDIEDEEKMSEFIQSQKEQWGFTDFYFISSDGSYLTVEGKTGFLDFKEEMARLIKNKESVMVDVALPGSPELQVFAVPTVAGSYKGFAYEAIAISYDNSDMIKTLNVSAFHGRSASYVVFQNGRVLLDNVAEEEQHIFNFLAFLENNAEMSDEQIKELKQEFQKGDSGVTVFRADGENYYLVYSSVKIQDVMVLGVVPVRVVNFRMKRLQLITMMVFISITVILGAVLIMLLILKNRKNLAEKDMDIMYREELFSTLSDNVDDIFFMLDEHDFQPNYVSPNIEKLLGITVWETQDNIHIMEKLVMGKAAFDILEQLPGIAAGEHREWEREYIHQMTGETRWFHVLAYRADICGQGKYIIVLSDRTKEQKMNQSLTNALELAKSANKAKSNFLASMSHDIRTPMNAIVGFAALLGRDAEIPEKVREYTRKITFSSQHLLGLINDILDMSKIESGQTTLNVTEFPLEDLMEEIYTIVLPQAKMKNQKLEFRTKGNLPQCVQGDRVRLNQILLNLLSNGVKYTQEGGQVSLTVEALPQNVRNHAHLRFVVADNGYGMSREFIKIIFDPFSREYMEEKREIHGTGLGMAITWNIVDLMGGTISVESTPGEGSVFTVELELQTVSEYYEQDTKGEMSGDQPEISLAGLHILAAEDNEINAEILQELLAMEGAVCEMAGNGQEALERFERAEAGEFDLIVLDIQMPVMDGYEAARRIRSCGHVDAATIPMIAMTANAYVEDVRRALEAGMNAHTAKPVDMDNLKNIVRQLVGKENGTR